VTSQSYGKVRDMDVVPCGFSLLCVFEVISFSGPIWAELEPG